MNINGQNVKSVYEHTNPINFYVMEFKPSRKIRLECDRLDRIKNVPSTSHAAKLWVSRRGERKYIISPNVCPPQCRIFAESNFRWRNSTFARGPAVICGRRIFWAPKFNSLERKYILYSTCETSIYDDLDAALIGKRNNWTRAAGRDHAFLYCGRDEKLVYYILYVCFVLSLEGD